MQSRKFEGIDSTVKRGIRLILIFLLSAPGGLIPKAEAVNTSEPAKSLPAPKRIIVKFKPQAAANIESELPADTLNIDDTSRHPKLPAILRKLARHKMQPLHPDHVRMKKLRGWTSSDMANQVRQKYPDRAHHWAIKLPVPDLTRTYILEPPNATAGQLQNLVNQLRKDPDVENAELDQFMPLSFIPNDPSFTNGTLWNMNKISAPAAWDVSFGDNVIVADIDTGVYAIHPDLQANLITGYDFSDATTAMRDDNGHGTHTAGIIAAVANNGIGVIGVSPHVRLMPIRIGIDAGGGANTGGINVILAIQAVKYAADHGAQVVNMSWGGVENTALEDSLEYAHALNVVLVAAAGNNNMKDIDTLPFCPACSPTVIAVGATGDTLDNLAAFSNVGAKVDVTAPGGGITSTVPPFAPATGLCDLCSTSGYNALSGTSMAAPHVAGLAALIISHNPGITNEQVRQIIRASADDAGTAGWDSTFGYGRINAARALQITGSSTVPMITNLSQASINAGSGNLTITVNGTNFQPGSSVIQMRHLTIPSAYATLTNQQFISSTQMRATILAADLTAVDYLTLRVLINGVGPSNSWPLLVTSGGPVNQQPTISACSPINTPCLTQTVTFPGPLTVSGSSTDDGLPNPPGHLSYQWSTFSGPGQAVFANSTALSTTVQFPAAGSYVLQLTGTDGQYFVSSNLAVTVNPSSGQNPNLAVTPTSLTFSAVAGGANPASKPITLSNGGTSVSNWTVSSDSSWLTASPTNGSIPAQTPGPVVNATATVGSMTAGTYTGHLTFNDQSGIPKVVTVTFTVSTPQVPNLGVSPTAMTFTAAAGGANPAAQQVTLSNAGPVASNWTATPDSPWLTASPANGSIPAVFPGPTVAITASVGALAANTYTGHVVFTDQSGIPKSVTVTFTVTAPQGPNLGVSPTAMTFTAVAGGANPAAQQVTLSNAGTLTSNWTATPDSPWLTALPSNGSIAAVTPGPAVSITASVGALAANTYTGHVVFTDQSGIPKSVAVTFTVTPPTIPVPVCTSGSCSADGQTVTLTWNAVSGTPLYAPQYLDNGVGPTSIAWTSALTESFTSTPGHSYSAVIFETQNGGSTWSNASNACPPNPIVCPSAPPPPPHLTLTKSANTSTAKSGDKITFTIQYQNTSITNAVNSVVSDPIPAGTALVPGSISSGGILTPTNTVQWILGTVAAGSSGTLTFQVQVN